jgi:hypothetical protein
MDMKLGGSQSLCGRYGEEKNITVLGIESEQSSR